MHASGWISWSQLPFKINHSSLRQLNPLQNDRLIDALGGNDRQFHTKQGEIVLHVIFLSQQNTPCPRLIKIWYCAHCHESHFRSTSYLKWTSSSKCRLWVFAFWKIDLKAKRTMSCLPHNHIYFNCFQLFLFIFCCLHFHGSNQYLNYFFFFFFYKTTCSTVGCRVQTRDFIHTWQLGLYGKVCTCCIWFSFCINLNVLSLLSYHYSCNM